MWHISVLKALSEFTWVLQNGGKRAKFRPSGMAVGSARLMFFPVRSSHNSQNGKTYRPGWDHCCGEEREAALLTTFSQGLWSNGVWMYTFSILQNRSPHRHHWFNQHHAEKEWFVTRISCFIPQNNGSFGRRPTPWHHPNKGSGVFCEPVRILILAPKDPVHSNCTEKSLLRIISDVAVTPIFFDKGMHR